MLLGVQHHVGQRHLVGAAQSLAQECIDLFSTAIGGEVVGRVDVLQRNFLAVDKGKNIDGLGCLGVSSTDFLSAEHHIAALLIGHALDDIFLADFLAGDLVHPLVADRLHAAFIQPVEVHALRRGGGGQCNGDMHQAETDGAFPDGSRHAGRLPPATRVRNGNCRNGCSADTAGFPCPCVWRCLTTRHSLRSSIEWSFSTSNGQLAGASVQTVDRWQAQKVLLKCQAARTESRYKRTTIDSQQRICAVRIRPLWPGFGGGRRGGAGPEG